MSERLWVAALAAALLGGAASAAEIRFAPGTALTLNPAYPPKEMSDVFAQMVAIRTGPRERLEVGSVRFELLKGGRVIATQVQTGEEAAAGTRAFLQDRPPPLQASQFLNPKGLAGWFGAGAAPATSASLAPNEVLLEPDVYFAVDDRPDTLRVVVQGQAPDGPKQIEASIPVRIYRSPVDYRLPVRGAWLEASLPIMQSHHRWNAPTEYAVDFFKVNGDGETTHDGSAEASHWYAYGEPVMAAADGVVVQVIDDRVQDRAFLALRPGETAGQRSERVNREIETRALADFPRSLLGNIIVLRHQVGETVEYSSYEHLKTGSARVKVGDNVRRGEVVAEVGDTGDTPVAHLHFEINAGPDTLYSQSLPFHFSDVQHNGSTQDPGWFVESK
ncbi:MAG TPA: M23 family metallopeptidase [Caulobacteraceae bacterium]|jgi:murein DD-endopeptidase MepM/ murein hydrolase activator NlpD